MRTVEGRCPVFRLVAGLSCVSALVLVLSSSSLEARGEHAGPFPARAGAAEQVAQAASGDDLLSGDGQNSSSGDDLLSGDGQSSGDDLLSGDGQSSGDDLLSGDGQSSGDDLLSGDGQSSGDDLLSGEGQSSGDDLLSGEGESSGGGQPSVDDLLFGNQKQPAEPEKKKADTAFDEHEKLFLENRYPSANTCATCHPKQYEEWSVSQHAYSQLSPVYMAFQMAINQLTSGTNGDFCIRCHNQVGMNLGESLYASNLDRHPTSREGITCVVCHRVDKNYGKVSGRLALVEGDLFTPVYGPTGDKELKRVLSLPQKYRVVTDRNASGRAIHTDVKRFFPLVEPSFCGDCHDVTLLNGFRLEEAFSEYKRSPASTNGVTCQDCHMGKVQGANAGYEEGPAAIVGGVPTEPRKLSNHFFAGPDYSVIHPGIFPHNVKAAEFKTLREWLQFDYKAGWGTDEFENNVPDDYKFPDAWFSIDDRYDARKIIDEQLKRLAWARGKRLEVLRNGFHLGEIKVNNVSPDGFEMSVDVQNATDGHAVPTGFDAERLIYLEVTVKDRDGKVVYVSGDRDPNGDVRDTHSLYVHNDDLPVDEDLFSLQSKFVVRLVRGGEREQVLAINQSVAAQPFIRPETRATTIYGRPLGARKHKQTIDPLGSRTAEYDISGDKLDGDGPYDVTVRLIAQMIPVNLIAAIQGVGFDYGMSPKEIADNVVAGQQVVWERHLKVDVATGKYKEVAQLKPKDDRIQ